MKKALLSIFLFFSINGFCTVWTITTGNGIFIPSTLNINAGDTVNVVATTMHDANGVYFIKVYNNGEAIRTEKIIIQQ